MAAKGNLPSGSETGFDSKNQKARAVENVMREDGTSLSFRSLLRESILGFAFWSLFQGLGPMVWFYPLNDLEISGYECAVVVWFSPLLVGIPGVLRLIQNKWVLSCLRLLTVASLGSFQAQTTLSRLVILAVGNGTALLVLTANLWSPSHTVRYRTVWGLILGLHAFVSSRIWFISFVPSWWNVTSNTVIISICSLSTFDIVWSDTVSKPSSSKATVAPYWLPTGLGWGSLLYLTHWCFGEVSIITRWVVRGYPETGPSPNPWGGAVLLAITCGSLLAWRGVSESLVWCLLGTCGLCALYYLPTWTGFIGGLLLAAFTFSLWPDLTERLSLCPPARTLLVAVLIYLIEIFFSVWTVAYNFVPGGVYTREHTDYLIGCVCFCILIGLFTSKRRNQPCSFTDCDTDLLKKAAKNIKLVILLLGVCGLGGFVYRWDPGRHDQPVKKEPKEFVAAIWTYHFGYDNRGWPSLERSAEMLNNTGADVITLLESDASKPFLGNNDLGMWLGEKLNMYVDFGPSTKDHTWGNLLLSKYPIVRSSHHLLPSPEGELAPAITATVNFSGSLVDFVVTHMGNDRDQLDRKLQAQFLAKELKKSSGPAVFLGYVTSAPHTSNYYELINRGGMKDIESSDSSRWCEYIMYKNLIRLGYARVSHGGLSDTELQMARFRIPSDPGNYTDHDETVTKDEQVPQEQRFTKKFGSYGKGHNHIQQHRYHMSTPRYYLPRKKSSD